MVYDFEGILAPLNEHFTDNLSYLSTIHLYTLLFMIHWVLDRESVYLVDKNPESLIRQFIKVLAEKEEAIDPDVLKDHSYPSDFQMLPGDVKKQCNQCFNQFSVIGFSNGKYYLNMMRKYFVRELSFNKGHDRS